MLKFVLVGVHYITCMHMFVLLTSKRQSQVIFSLVPCHYINIVLFVEKKNVASLRTKQTKNMSLPSCFLFSQVVVEFEEKIVSVAKIIMIITYK